MIEVFLISVLLTLGGAGNAMAEDAVPSPAVVVPSSPECYEPQVNADGVRVCGVNPNGSSIEQCLVVLNSKILELS